MEKSILLSTALALGLTASNTSVSANDQLLYKENSSSDNSQMISKDSNNLFQQKEVTLSSSSQNEYRQTPTTDNKTQTEISSVEGASKNNAENTHSAVQENEQTVDQTYQAPKPTYYQQPTAQHKYNRVASHRNVNIKCHRLRHINSLRLNHQLQVSTNRRPNISPINSQSINWRLAPMTMDNLLHASTNNPLAGRRHYVSKHIKKLPTAY